MNALTYVERSRQEHHKALEALTPLTAHHKGNGLKLWRQLRRIEGEANAAATAQCNGEAYQGHPFRADAAWEAFKEQIARRVESVLGTLPTGFFVNGDPRGYALKIDPDAKGANIPPGMHRDWGNYGLLAPVIE